MFNYLLYLILINNHLKPLPMNDYTYTIYQILFAISTYNWSEDQYKKFLDFISSDSDEDGGTRTQYTFTVPHNKVDDLITAIIEEIEDEDDITWEDLQ